MARCGGPRFAGAVAMLVLASVLAACTSATDADRTDADAATTTGPSAARIPACDTSPTDCATRIGDLRLEVTGPVSDVRTVGPADDSPLRTIDRDAGISVQLRDGSIVWLFGDTAARGESGLLEYFVIGTGAWAPADRPTQTSDHVGVNGEPVALATPTPSFPPCPQPSQRPGMWPASAVVQPVGGRDRVIIWFDNICLGERSDTGPVLDDMGTSVAEWWYDPTAPPVDVAITVTILNQQLFPTRSFGSGATLTSVPGEVVTYACEQPATTDDVATTGFGPCTAARTSADTVADPSTYLPWNGRTFGPDGAAASPMVMPEASAWPYPVGGFTVTRDPTVGAYVMAYSPWPADSDAMQLRIAERPEGPWSRPVSIRLPGCDDRIGSRRYSCYAATAQPAFSSPGHVGIGYYDSMVSSFPTRGTYTIATVPVTVG